MRFPAETGSNSSYMEKTESAPVYVVAVPYNRTGKQRGEERILAV